MNNKEGGTMENEIEVNGVKYIKANKSDKEIRNGLIELFVVFIIICGCLVFLLIPSQLSSQEIFLFWVFLFGLSMAFLINCFRMVMKIIIKYYERRYE